MPNLTVIGGDERMCLAAEFLREKGMKVDCRGFPGDNGEDGWREAVASSDVVILPLPASMDGVRIYSPLSPWGELRFSVLLSELPKGCRLFGGKLPLRWREQAEKRGYETVDVTDSEAFQLRNALPTAEAALLLAMEKQKATVSGSQVSVVGYGRIASLLARKLRLLGARAAVFARKETDRIKAGLEGIPAYPIEQFPLRSQGSEVIFNTVPTPVLTGELLRSIGKDCLLMELASAPGGFDLQAVRERKLNYLPASGLPGKYFPKTAAKCLAETLMSLL